MTKYFFSPTPQKNDCLIVPLFENNDLSKIAKELDKEFGGTIERLVKTNDFEGKKMQSAFVYTENADLPRILLIGLGKQDELTVRRLKQAFGAATIMAQGKKMSSLAFLVPEFVLRKIEPTQAGREMVSAVEVAAYAYDNHKQMSDKVTPLKKVGFIGSFSPKQKKSFLLGMKEGEVLGQSTNFVRELGNTPPSVMNPTLLANETKKITKISKKVTVKVLTRQDAERLKMGCFLAVAKGSDQEPKFIVVEYKGGKASERPTVLVGKGITFDSGGLSLKPGDYMTDMKYDMLGAATALGTVMAAATLGIKKNIVVLAPACENMPSGKAYRPDDILTAMNGKTVLVENTDAEGRLILADALCYAASFKPKEVIDFATLTGACMVALGNERSGLFTSEDDLADGLVNASKQAGEQLWRLPVGEEYSEAIKSEIADVKNLGGVGNPRFGGASTAAAFLEFFTKDAKTGESLYPWAHIDLSCSYYGGKGKPWVRYGANGFGVATMVEYLRK